MRVLVADLVSPSYFTATAAVELGFFKDEGVPAEVVPAVDSHRQSLLDPDIHFGASSAYGPLHDFPNWNGAKLLCALAQNTYWFLVLRSGLGAKRGDVHAVKGLRIGAAASPGLGLRCLLAETGIDLDRENIKIGDIRLHGGREVARSRIGVEGLRSGNVDGFWGNAMRAEMAMREGIGSILLDVRRGRRPAGEHVTTPSRLFSPLTSLLRNILMPPQAPCAPSSRPRWPSGQILPWPHRSDGACFLLWKRKSSPSSSSATRRFTMQPYPRRPSSL